MLTSHYGPRQGIYQSMESFRNPHWRTLHYSVQVFNKVYCYKTKTRILSPPNSFPARSLIRHDPNYYGAGSVMQLTVTKAVPHPPGTHPTRPLPPPPPPPPVPRVTARPAVLSTPQCKIRAKDSSTPPPHTTPSRHHRSTALSASLTSRTAEIHSRGSSIKSQTPYSSTFPYPDSMKQGNSAFTARLAALAKLECETIHQEVLGSRWGSSHRPTSAHSIPSTSSLKPQLPAQDKSAKGERKSGPRLKTGRGKIYASSSKIELKEERKPAQSVSSVDVLKQSSISQSELCSSVSVEPGVLRESTVDLGDSTSDLGCSIESLCLNNPEEAVKGSRVTGQEAWQPPGAAARGLRGGGVKTKERRKSKDRKIYKSASSCSLKGRKASPKRKRPATKSAKIRAKS